MVNDNSAGNDAIICDKSITSVADLKGKTVAAEEGVVDHFLLLQGLAEAGMTQDDIDFRGVLTADAAARFAGGQFDCVGVFAPFTLEALEAAGLARACSARRTSRARSPTTSWCRSDLVAERPEDVQKIVERLVRHARLHRGQPRRGAEDHGRQGRGVDRGLRGLRRRHEDLHRRRGARGLPAR